MTGLGSPDPPAGGCAMAPLVEARRDGRLGEREAMSLERHLGSCSACRALVADLDRLGALVKHPALPALSPLERQRGRVKLLRAAALGSGAASTPLPDRPPMVLSRWKAAFAAAALVAGALVAGRALGPRHEPPPVAQAAAPRTETTVDPGDGARYQRSTQDGLDVVRLSSGSLNIGVRPLGPRERFLVRTGDAEIEVRGTLFGVAVDGDRLLRVDVKEGKVEVRYAGAMVLVGAGSSWQAPASAMGPRGALAQAGAAGGSDPGPQAALDPAQQAGPELNDPAQQAAKDPVQQAVPTSPKVVRVVAKAKDESAALGDGVDLIERGDYGAAAERLAAFRRSHPADARAEDAAFLTIVALQRAGRREAAATAARDYLGSYPAGRRRAEAQAIAASN